MTAPAYVEGHGLLADRVALVTAAAGAGIGAAVVRRVLEEGAKAVVFSDTHERRVAEAHEALATEFGEGRVLSTVTDVTQEEQVVALLDLARSNGAYDDPVVRDRLARADVELEVIRLNALRTLAESGTAEQSQKSASVAKLLWARWHRTLGDLAMQVRGKDSLTTGADYDLDEWQRLYLFTRADTIYGGSDEIQRNILAERVLGLPREARA